MVRIYYPSVAIAKSRSPYYKTLLRSMQNDLTKIPGVTKKHQLQLNNIKSFSAENIEIVPGVKFPVIIFSPGFGSPVEMYGPSEMMHLNDLEAYILLPGNLPLTKIILAIR